MAALNTELDRPAILGGGVLFGGDPPAWPPHDSSVQQMLQRMGEDGSWGRYFGPHGDRLVERLQQMHDCEHVLLCSSGRAAVELALRGLHVEPGNEVAMAAYDFHSNFAGIQRLDALPVLCEVNAADAQLDVALVDGAITTNTHAIIASHLQGGVVDMPTLRELADAHHLAVIEDACQASGATVAGRPAGMWGDVGILSFGGTKLLTAGRGGALLTNRADVIQRIRRYLRGDNHTCPLSEMQAAVLLPQLDQLPQRHQRRLDAVARLDEVLANVNGLKRFETVGVEGSPAFYKVGLFYDTAAFEGLPREWFCRAMQAEGLTVDPGFPALQTIHSTRRFRAADDLTSAACAGETVIGLHHPILLAEEVDWTRLATAVERIRSHVSQIREAKVDGTRQPESPSTD